MSLIKEGFVIELQLVDQIRHQYKKEVYTESAALAYLTVKALRNHLRDVAHVRLYPVMNHKRGNELEVK